MGLKTKIIVAAALIACCPLAAQADIYQFTDESGVVHFTNVSGGKKHKRVRKESSGRSLSYSPPSRSDAPAPITSSNFPSAYVDIINSACTRHGVDASLVHALVKVESDFNPYAVSRKGAMGLMQLMPQTALEWNVRDSFNPVENIDGGVKYLRYLIDRYEGNLSLALAAYNSGETAVKKWGTIPPYRETQNYVQRIMKLYSGKGYTGGGFTRASVSQYTIYMGYSDDGSLVLTDNPSNHPKKKLKAAKKNL
ncbi:MAG: hypothetical protein A2078_03125 [Nitrospirae bacterium GWC2_57_9]|nr:MAG: hypothetical protein A2078_03125 [Nitrospirae bacterium GWC2_57_9]